MIYNYRFDRRLLSEITERIRTNHVLSQGWGGGNDINLNIVNKDFVEKCTAYYELATTRVPSNLTRIRDFKRGDLLVIPHLPAHGKVSIHVIADDFPKCYNYVVDKDHQNHLLSIEKSYGLDGSISIYHLGLTSWYGKLQWLRLPILPIPQHEVAFCNIIDEIEKSPTIKFEPSLLAEYLNSLREELIHKLNSKLQEIKPSGAEISFESVCEQLLKAAGYKISARNQYNSEGGDVDLHCVRDRSDVSPFEAGQTTLFVQVKKHTGNTDEWSVQQLLGMIKQEPTADGCVMSLGDSFTQEAQELAEKNGILLMNGDVICQLLLGELGNIDYS